MEMLNILMILYVLLVGAAFVCYLGELAEQGR